MRSHIPIDQEKMQAFCERWHITSFAFFGSVLREDFRPDSDIDVLVTFAPDAHITLFDLAKMSDELQQMFGREVDLLERNWIEASHNPIRRKEILTTAEEVYRAVA